MRKNTELFRGIFNQAAIGIAITDPERKIVQANRKICEFLGYDFEELFGTTLRAATHPDFIPEVDEQIRKLVDGEVESATIENLYVRRDGTTVWGKWTSSLIRDKHGAPEFIISVIQDIDACKIAEAKAREAAEILANSQRIAHLGSWDLDIVEDRERWSDEVYRIFGLEPQSIDFTGYGFLDYVHPEDREKAKAAQDDAIAQHKPYSVEYRLLRPDGIERTVYEYAELEFDDQGAPVRLSGTIQDVTERKQAELALQRTTKQLTEAQRLAHVGNWEWDPDSIASEWSDETFRIFGLEPKEDVPTHQAFLRNIIHPADHATLEQAMEETLRTGRPYTMEFRIVRPDGKVRTVTESCERYVPEHSDRPRLRGVLQDITELKQTEANLRETSRRLELAQKQAKVGYWRWSFAEERLTYWSEEAARISQYPLKRGPLGYDEMLGPIHPDDRPRVEAEFAAADEERRDLSLEYRVVHEDGRVTHIREIGEVEYDVNGKPVGHVGFVQDITELRQIEQELTEAQRIGGIGHWRLDLKKRQFTHWSDELYRIFGVEKDSFEPTLDRFLAAIHEDDLQASIENQEAALAEKRPYQFEHRIVRPTGEIRVIWGEARPEFNDNREPTMVFGITQDVTEARQRESELRQAQKMEAVGQLTGGVAHDFNNLLGVIIGNLELAQELTDADTRLGRMLESVVCAADRGASLTKRLLAFSRKQPLRPRLVKANELVEHTLKLLARTLGEEVEIEIVSDHGLWTCMVDPAQLESAIVNMAINARDAMPGGGKLTIETSNTRIDDAYAPSPLEVDPGEYVVVAISDCGSGMPPETLEHVFEPFFTTKDVGAGSGLGLSMVYGFIKQSGGHVTICSEVGEGTTIRLYLPRYVGNSELFANQEQNDEFASAGDEVILVVEDDEDLRALIVNILRSLGYGVLESNAASAALEIVEVARQVNLLLTDLILPGGMNGRQLADLVQTKRPDIQVLYMSGYAEDAVIHQGRLEMGIQLLEKPFRKKDVAHAIRKALDCRPD